MAIPVIMPINCDISTHLEGLTALASANVICIPCAMYVVSITRHIVSLFRVLSVGFLVPGIYEGLSEGFAT